MECISSANPHHQLWCFVIGPADFTQWIQLYAPNYLKINPVVYIKRSLKVFAALLKCIHFCCTRTKLCFMLFKQQAELQFCIRKRLTMNMELWHYYYNKTWYMAYIGAAELSKQQLWSVCLENKFVSVCITCRGFHIWNSFYSIIFLS